MSSSIPFYTASDIARLLPLDTAMDALEHAVRVGGVDPELDNPRLFSDAPGGEFLLMPAQGPEYSGLKALTVAPENPAKGLEKIQGVYILFSSDTLAPVALMEGASLTSVRTAAVTVSAIRQLGALAPVDDAVPARPRVLVFGAGNQALSHTRAIAFTYPEADVRIVGRRPERVIALIEALAEFPETRDLSVRAVESQQIERQIPSADIVICVTSDTRPLFDGSLVRDGAIVAAAGTHGRDKREVDDTLVGRADLVVEGRNSALRENGNLVSLTAQQWEGSGRPASTLR